jgi:S-DNA-T family DNA segregation ATPase FtsK/SpoIIIE
MENKICHEAARLIVTTQNSSAGFLKRKLKINNEQAYEIMEILERKKVLGAFDGTKHREILVKDTVSLEGLLNTK